MLVDGVDDDGVLVGRTHREAPEIDGVVRLVGTRRRVRPPGRDRARDGERRRGPRPRREGRRRVTAAAAAPPPSRATKRFGQNALATPANFVTLEPASLVAIPTLRSSAADGSEWLTVGAVVRDHRHRQPRRLARAARRHDPLGRVPRPVADKLIVLGGFAVLADRGVFPWWAVAARRGARGRHLRVPLGRGPARHRAARAAARQVQGVHAVLRGRLRAAAARPPTESASSTSCSGVAVALTVVSGLEIVRRGYIDWQRVET